MFRKEEQNQGNLIPEGISQKIWNEMHFEQISQMKFQLPDNHYLLPTFYGTSYLQGFEHQLAPISDQLAQDEGLAVSFQHFAFSLYSGPR